MRLRVSAEQDAFSGYGGTASHSRTMVPLRPALRLQAPAIAGAVVVLVWLFVLFQGQDVQAVDQEEQRAQTLILSKICARCGGLQITISGRRSAAPQAVVVVV